MYIVSKVLFLTVFFPFSRSLHKSCFCISKTIFIFYFYEYNRIY